MVGTGIKNQVRHVKRGMHLVGPKPFFPMESNLAHQIGHTYFTFKIGLMTKN